MHNHAADRAAALASYRTGGADSVLPGPLGSVVYPPSLPSLLVWLGVVIVAAAWLARQGAARAIWLVPGTALLLQVPHAALVWHGGPLEIPRHALQVGVLTRLSLLVLTIFLIDAALGLRNEVDGRDRVPARPSA